MNNQALLPKPQDVILSVLTSLLCIVVAVVLWLHTDIINYLVEGFVEYMYQLETELAIFKKLV